MTAVTPVPQVLCQAFVGLSSVCPASLLTSPVSPVWQPWGRLHPKFPWDLGEGSSALYGFVLQP